MKVELSRQYKEARDVRLKEESEEQSRNIKNEIENNEAKDVKFSPPRSFRLKDHKEYLLIKHGLEL